MLVHQDLHDSNVLADAEGGIAAFIDFDDLLVGWRVAEPAITAAYLARHTADPRAAVDAVAAGREAMLPFSDAEGSGYRAIALAREGLVTHERNRGAVVRAFTLGDIRDLYRVRRTLEGQGAASCLAAPLLLLQAVDRAYERLADSARSGQDTVEHALMDLRFHAAAIVLIGSARTDQFFEQIAVEMAYAIRLIQHDEVDEPRLLRGELIPVKLRYRPAPAASTACI